MRIRAVAAMLVVGLTGEAFAQAAPKVVVGDNPSLSGAPLYVALEKGYYREAGIDVQLEMSGTSSDMAVLLATNRIQVIGGAISAGFFNSLSKGLPIGVLMSRATSPYAHYLMIRPDLRGKLREPADLKGRTVAVAARGAILLYELAKVLETGGLSLADVELKYIPFRPDADRAHDRRGRRRADDLAAAGCGRGQRDRGEMDQCRPHDQGAAGGDLGMADEYRLGAPERGRGEEIRARHVARRA